MLSPFWEEKIIKNSIFGIYACRSQNSQLLLLSFLKLHDHDTTSTWLLFFSCSKIERKKEGKKKSPFQKQPAKMKEVQIKLRCNMCIHEIDDSTTYVVTRCRHVFCMKDAMEWFQNNIECPKCQKVLDRWGGESNGNETGKAQIPLSKRTACRVCSYFDQVNVTFNYSVPSTLSPCNASVCTVYKFQILYAYRSIKNDVILASHAVRPPWLTEDNEWYGTISNTHTGTAT